VEYIVDKDENERLIAKDVTGHEQVDLQPQKS
jgi:phage pi2 protein 07